MHCCIKTCISKHYKIADDAGKIDAAKTKEIIKEAIKAKSEATWVNFHFCQASSLIKNI
jgi:hypothetical protein